VGNYAGRSYVVFGQTDKTVINLADVVKGIGGFVINGYAVHNYSTYVNGFSVSGAGDFNGDGLADHLVGASYDTNTNLEYEGRS